MKLSQILMLGVLTLSIHLTPKGLSSQDLDSTLIRILVNEEEVEDLNGFYFVLVSKDSAVSEEVRWDLGVSPKIKLNSFLHQEDGYVGIISEDYVFFFRVLAVKLDHHYHELVFHLNQDPEEGIDLELKLDFVTNGDWTLAKFKIYDYQLYRKDVEAYLAK